MPIEQMRLFADGHSNTAKLYVEHDKTVDEWLKARHYLACVPAGAVIRMCFKDDTGNILGCMMWGRPTSRKIDQEKILELTRMHFIDETARFIESHCLSMARKYIRKHYPRIKGLIAYSSTGAGHEGTVYEADGWFALGGSAGGSWENRSNRTNRDLTQKTRWVRSP